MTNSAQRLLVATTGVIALAAILAGCGSNSSNSTNNSAAKPAGSAAASASATTASSSAATVAATTAGSPAAASISGPKKDLTVQLNFIPNVEHYAIEYAAHEGLYDKLNLKVDVAPGGQGIDPVQVVAAGKALIGVTSAEAALTAYSQGIKLKVFAVEFQKSPIALTCRKDSGVTKISDIVGKKIGLKPNVEDQFNALLAKNNIDRSKLTIIPIGQSSVTEIIAGTTQCEFTTFATNEPLTMQQNGVTPVVMLISDNGLPSQSDVYFTSADQYDKNKDVLARWTAATQKAWATFIADPNAAAKYMVDKAFIDGLDLGQQTGEAVAQAPLIVSDLTKQKDLMWIDPAIWQQTAQTLFDAKTTPTLVDPTNVITTEILNMATQYKPLVQ